MNCEELIAHIVDLMRHCRGKGMGVYSFSPAMFYLKTVRQPMVRGCGLPRRMGVKQGSSPAGAVGRAVTVTTLRNVKARSTATSSNPAAPHAAELS